MIHDFKVCTTHSIERNLFIFPFLLSKQEPLEICTKWESCLEKKYGFIGRSYKVPFITYGFFEKLFVLMGEHISGAILFWRHGFLLESKEEKESTYLWAKLSYDNTYFDSTEFIIEILVSGTNFKYYFVII